MVNQEDFLLEGLQVRWSDPGVPLPEGLSWGQALIGKKRESAAGRSSAVFPLPRGARRGGWGAAPGLGGWGVGEGPYLYHVSVCTT